MNRVVIESPFNPPSVELCAPWSRYEVARQNIVYARMALLDSLLRGESPVASHLLYTQVWSELPALRAAGIAAGVAQHEAADVVAFYVDLGVSPGMLTARNSAGAKAEGRTLFSGCTTAQVRDHLAPLPIGGWPLLEQLVREMRPGSAP